MGKPVSVHPLVHHDVASIFDYIAEDDPVAADRVARTIFRQFSKFGAHPGIGTPYLADAPELAGIRMFPIPRYRNYLVFYVERGDEIRILYVYHSLLAQHPGADGQRLAEVGRSARLLLTACPIAILCWIALTQ